MLFLLSMVPWLVWVNLQYGKDLHNIGQDKLLKSLSKLNGRKPFFVSHVYQGKEGTVVCSPGRLFHRWIADG